MAGPSNAVAAAVPAGSVSRLSSSVGSSDSYNGNDARHFCHDLEEMRNLYTTATELNDQFENHLNAQRIALAAADAEAADLCTWLSEADFAMAGKMLS
jgi:hypothetical protein